MSPAERRRAQSRARYLRKHPKARRHARHAPSAELLGPARLPRPHLAERACIGCGQAPVLGRTYCDKCKARLAANIPVDLDEVPTARDLESVRAAEARQGRAPARFNTWRGRP